MQKEAEDFAEAANKRKITSTRRMNFETYCCNIKNPLSDKSGESVVEEDKEKMTKVVTEALEWLEDATEADTNDFRDKLKEVQDICQPIIAKVYQKSGTGALDEDEEDEDSTDHSELGFRILSFVCHKFMELIIKYWYVHDKFVIIKRT